VAHSSIAVLRIDEARVDMRALMLVTGIGGVATLLFAGVQLALALRVPPHQALSALGRGLHGTRGDARLRASFLVTQLGFALLITIVTAALARSLVHLQSVALGYRPDSVFVARVALPPRRSESVPVLARFVEDMERALHESPGVVAAGVTSIAPLSEGLRIVPFSVVGRAPERDDERLEANIRFVSPGYFDAIGASVMTGRPFTEGDRENAAPVAIVSRALATRYFTGAEPMGRQLLVHDNNEGPRPITVVGVVDDMRHVTLEGPPTVDVYMPMAQVHRDELRFVTARQFWTVRVATAGKGSDYSRAFLRTLAAVDREVAVARVEPMGSYVDGSLAPRRFSVAALAGFAVTALVLAVIGVNGLVAYSVEQRRREIGLRLALGSTTAGVVRALVRPALALALIGVGIGIGGALLTQRLVAGLLFGVVPTDPVILLAVATALLVTCAVAVVIPARRAAAIDPAIALRDG
jgi:predicted permease